MSRMDSASSNLLDWMYRDVAANEIFSIASTFCAWTRVEIALSQAHFEFGIISQDELSAIKKLADLPTPDLRELREGIRNVGYPIIELLKYLNGQLPEEHRGVLHLGATTQDIMDTALSLQVVEAGKLVLEHLTILGNAVEGLVAAHSKTLMPGRTHAQQAVPTTFGLKCAVYLSEITRHRERLERAVEEAGCVSLFGAAGTSAAMGEHESEVREVVARELSLKDVVIPWHASRDRFIEITNQCANLSVTLVRLAREIIDLSRTEINEVYEPGGAYKGASSTMPQKRNPVMSEAIVGIGLEVVAQAHAMLRAGEVGHERAAGEWQLEWKALPEVLIDTVSALKLSAEMMQGLSVNVDVMKSNVEMQNGAIMAEAYMIELAKKTGREVAHSVVHEASKLSAEKSIPLTAALLELRPQINEELYPWPISPSDYVGNAEKVCALAITNWHKK